MWEGTHLTRYLDNPPRYSLAKDLAIAFKGKPRSWEPVLDQRTLSMGLLIGDRTEIVAQRLHDEWNELDRSCFKFGLDDFKNIGTLMRFIIELVKVFDRTITIGQFLGHCHDKAEHFKPFLSDVGPRFDDLYILYVTLYIINFDFPLERRIRFHSVFNRIVKHSRSMNRSLKFLPRLLLDTKLFALKESMANELQRTKGTPTTKSLDVEGRFRHEDFSISSLQRLG